MTRRATLQFFALVSLVATLGYAVDESEPDSRVAETETTPDAVRHAAAPHELDGADDGGVRLREGMKFVNKIGELREAGGVVAFYPDGDTHSLQLLENLALERVSRDLDQPHRKWSVTGVVTEYKGSNFLLLQRAVLKARVSSALGPQS